MSDKLSAALREIALSYAAHEPMNPTTPKWIALSKLLPAPEPETPPVQLSLVEVEMHEQPADQAEALRRDLEHSRAVQAEQELQIRNLTRKLEALANPQK